MQPIANNKYTNNHNRLPMNFGLSEDEMEYIVRKITL